MCAANKGVSRTFGSGVSERPRTGSRPDPNVHESSISDVERADPPACVRGARSELFAERLPPRGRQPTPARAGRARGGCAGGCAGAGGGAAGACAGAVLLTTCVMAALEPTLPPWIRERFHPQVPTGGQAVTAREGSVAERHRTELVHTYTPNCARTHTTLDFALFASVLNY